LLAPLGLLLRNLTLTPVLTIAHGLDITFNNRFYQSVLLPCLRKLDHIVCVSENTKDECLKRAVPDRKITVIPNGVYVDRTPGPDKAVLFDYLRTNNIVLPQNARLLLTVGRLVKRKGVYEFIRDVMPSLVKENSAVVYLVIGVGPSRESIEELIRVKSLTKNVFLLGLVSEELLRGAYAGCDVFVMPNKIIPDDVEGFGLVALEAASFGLPVIASDLEGIKDAVKDGVSGYLIPAQDTAKFREKIIFLLNHSQEREQMSRQAKEFANVFSWQNVGERYVRLMQQWSKWQ